MTTCAKNHTNIKSLDNVTDAEEEAEEEEGEGEEES